MELFCKTSASASTEQLAYERLQEASIIEKCSSPKILKISYVIGAVSLLIISITALVIALRSTSNNPETQRLSQTTPNNPETERLILTLNKQMNDLKAQVEHNRKSLNATIDTSTNPDDESFIQAMKEQLDVLKVRIDHNNKSLNATMEAISSLDMLKEELSQVNHTLNSRINSYHDKPVLATCPANYHLNPFSNTCYGLVVNLKTWQEAKDYCEADGGYLATFETLESASWFQNLRKTLPAWRGRAVWLAGKRNANNTWDWHGRITGPFTFSIWSPGHPDDLDGLENCLDNRYQNIEGRPYYIFNDYVCSHRISFACEKH